ncbi:MAG: hypothetical protein AAFN78_18675 [Pseudomonadota bacterium]
MRLLPLFRVLALAALAGMCSAAFADTGSGGDGDAEATAGATAEATAEAADDYGLKLVQTYYAFTRDLYAAGLDANWKQRLTRLELAGIATGSLSLDELFARFREPWLDIQRDIDKAKRVLICDASVLESSPTVRRGVTALGKHLERLFYEKSLALYADALLTEKQFDLEAALMTYAERIPPPRVFEEESSQIVMKSANDDDGSATAAGESYAAGYCSSPWEYEFILPGKNGRVSRHKVTL